MQGEQAKMYKIGLNRALMIANKIFEKLIYDISLSEGNLFMM